MASTILAEPAVTDPLDGEPKRSWPRRAWAKTPNWILSVLLGCALIGLVEFAVRSGWISDVIVARPSAIWTALRTMGTERLLWDNTWLTTKAALIGFVLAAASGIVVGGLFASISRLERVVYPFVVALQTLPKVALAPLTLIWFGFETNGKVAMVMLVAFFPILVSTLTGLRVRDLDEYYLFKSLGASRWRLFWHLRMPGAVPSIFTGLSLGLNFSLIGTTVAEFVGSQGGLGYLLITQRAAFNVPGLYAVLVVLMILGIVFNQVMSAIEKRIAVWSHDVTSKSV